MALKERLITAPMLAYPDFEIPFSMYATASGDSIGFNLIQIQTHWERGIVYEGRNFSGTENNDSISKRDRLAVVVAIRKCRPYLLGNHFAAFAEHQTLKWLMSLHDPTGRLALLALLLQGYDFTVQCHPCKDHGNADALPRCNYRISQQPMLPQTSVDEIWSA